MEHGICKQVLVGVGNLKAQIKRLKVETLNRKRCHDELWFKVHEYGAWNLQASACKSWKFESSNKEIES